MIGPSEPVGLPDDAVERIKLAYGWAKEGRTAQWIADRLGVSTRTARTLVHHGRGARGAGVEDVYKRSRRLAIWIQDGRTVEYVAAEHGMTVAEVLAEVRTYARAAGLPWPLVVARRAA